MPERKTLALLDASGNIYRAFHAIRPLNEDLFQLVKGDEVAVWHTTQEKLFDARPATRIEPG